MPVVRTAGGVTACNTPGHVHVVLLYTHARYMYLQSLRLLFQVRQGKEGRPSNGLALERHACLLIRHILLVHAPGTRLHPC